MAEYATIKESEEMDFLAIFGQIDDLRIDRKKLHPMPEILLLTLCAVICAAKSWDDIEILGKAKLDFLRQYLPYDYCVPSDDTVRHWGIANQLHWVLDMSFGEDQSRIRKGNAPANVAITRHAALNMIRQAQKKRMSIKRMRKSAGWDDSVLTDFLAQVF